MPSGTTARLTDLYPAPFQVIYMALPYPLSTFMDETAEIHAFVHGTYAGLTEWKSPQPPDHPDVAAEPHYYKGGYILGTLMRWGALIALGGMAFGL